MVEVVVYQVSFMTWILSDVVAKGGYSLGLDWEVLEVVKEPVIESKKSKDESSDFGRISEKERKKM